MDVKILISTLLVLLTVVIQRGLAEGECMHSCIQQTCNQKKFGPICYYVFNDLKMNWADSRSFCENQHLSMVKITREMLNSGHEVSDILPDIPNQNTGVWLGGKAKDFEKWQFLNNTEVQGLRFDTSDFRGHNFFNCGIMLIDSNSVESGIEPLEFDRNNMDFNTSNCYSKKYFACRLDPNEMYLIIVREEKTWFEAREYCLDLGGDLFYLKESEVKDQSFQFSIAIFDVGSPMLSVHVGLRHRRWEWIDGTEILYTNWDDSQPDYYLEKCLMMYGNTGKWNDDWCHKEKLIACQGGYKTRGPMELTSPDSNITPTQAMSTETEIQPSDFTVTESSGATESKISATESKFRVAIILGALLGAFFVIACALIGFLLCRKYRKKTLDTETEFMENPYYESSVDSDTGNSTTQDNTNGSTGVAMDTGTYSKVGQSDKELGIKTKKIVGPLTGDIYTLPGK